MPIVFIEFITRYQLILIAFKSHLISKIYQFQYSSYLNHLTRSVILELLEFKRPELFAYIIIDNFTLIEYSYGFTI